MSNPRTDPIAAATTPQAEPAQFAPMTAPAPAPADSAFPGHPADSSFPRQPAPAPSVSAQPADSSFPGQPAPANDKSATITLANPILRAGAPAITQLTLRKPKGGDLRGFSLNDLINLDVNATIAVVPRIVQPFITDAEVADLEADDFAEVGGALRGFFMNPAMRAAIDKLVGG